MTDLPIQDEKEIMQLTLEETLEYLELLALNGTKEDTEIYTKVRTGINHKFDIYNAIAENYKEKTKKNKIQIENTELTLTEFYTEIAERRATAKEHLINHIKNEIGIQRRV